MALYRKKPIALEASQWFKQGDHPNVTTIPEDYNQVCDIDTQGWIVSLEGGYVVTPGDWIITGTRGENWAVKPDIFSETYEAV